MSGVLEFLIANPNRYCKFLYNKYYTLVNYNKFGLTMYVQESEIHTRNIFLYKQYRLYYVCLSFMNI